VYLGVCVNGVNHERFLLKNLLTDTLSLRHDSSDLIGAIVKYHSFGQSFPMSRVYQRMYLQRLPARAM